MHNIFRCYNIHTYTYNYVRTCICVHTYVTTFICGEISIFNVKFNVRSKNLSKFMCPAMQSNP